MYICPVCKREYKEERNITKHLLVCWKRENPNHISKPAPRSEDITNREMNEDVMSFFAGF